VRAVVRTAVDGEAAALDDALGAPPGVYAGLLGMQAEGACVLLVAEVGGRPVGAGVLRWAPRDAAVRERFGALPEISNLQVHPDEQGRGHGTALVAAACARAAAAGQASVGIGVDEDNPDAARLYLRLGFADTGLRYVDSYTWVDHDGVQHDEQEAVRYLVRTPG
ncbi:Acyl-CoA N-acyltransferase, partial [Klenkia terrae]